MTISPIGINNFGKNPKKIIKNVLEGQKGSANISRKDRTQ